MSDVDNTELPEFVEENESTNGPKALREQNSKLAAVNKELADRLAKFEEAQRARTIADVLSGANANPGLAKYVARDIEGDVTEESVKAWLASEGALFGYQAEQESANVTDPATVEQAQRIGTVSAGAPAMPTGISVEQLKNMSAEQMISAGLMRL